MTNATTTKLRYKPLPSQERLKELFDYDPETGDFVRKVRTSNNTKVGDVAGCLVPDGYLVFRVDSTTYMAHRLAWLYRYGEDPGSLDIDHINRNRSDNRLENLRLATSQQNRQNSSALGITWDKVCRKWQARITVDGVLMYLGVFRHYWSAIHCYQQARLKYFGEFA